MTAAVAGPTALAYPAVSAIKSRLSAEAEQGRVQGAIAALKDLSGALGLVCQLRVFGCGMCLYGCLCSNNSASLAFPAA